MTDTIQRRQEPKYFMSFVWAAVFAANIILVSLVLAGAYALKETVSGTHTAGLVKEFKGLAEKSDVSIVLFGNSRLRHATTLGMEPEILKLSDGRDLAVLQFAPDSGRFTMLGDAPERILGARADILVIQNSMLTSTAAPGNAERLYFLSGIVFKYIKGLIKGESESQRQDRQRRELFKNCAFDYSPAAAREHLEFLDHYHHSTGDANTDYRAARDFVRKALDRNMRVVILRLRPYEEYFSRLSVPLHRVDFNGMDRYPEAKDLLPADYRRVLWRDYSPAGPADFCDDVHYNEAGRKRFTEWFLRGMVR